MNQELEDIQFKLAYLEQAFETLNNVVTDQQQRIHQLENKIKLMQQHLKEALPSDINAGEEKPPHY